LHCAHFYQGFDLSLQFRVSPSSHEDIYEDK
jgi:hypothetical protein